MKTKLLFFGMLFLLVGCGIFTPRDEFDEPDGNRSADPFNFDEILSGTTGESFISTDPDELFDNQMMYIDYNTGENKPFLKKQFTDNLSNLKQKYDFLVEWSDTTFRENGDSLYINHLKYRVEYREKGADSSKIKVQVGSSDFIIVDKTNRRICFWIDIPDNVDGQSFFAPIGSD